MDQDAKRLEEGLGGVAVKEGGDGDRKDNSNHDHQKVISCSNGGDVINIHHEDYGDQREERINVEAKSDQRLLKEDDHKEQAAEQQVIKQRSKRVATLDAFRGLTIVARLVWIILIKQY